MSKRTMSVVNTQLTLLVTWWLLEVAARNSRKLYQNSKVKQTTWKSRELGKCAWTKMRKQYAWETHKNKIKESKALKEWKLFLKKWNLKSFKWNWNKIFLKK
jgi:hypothetical protein